MKILCLGVMFGTSSGFGYAQEFVFQDGLDTLDIHNIEGVTIVGAHHTEVIPAQRLSGEILERLNSHSVADAIRFLSGVQIKDFGGIGGLKTVNIRSMGSHHVGVFFNGIRVGNAQNGVVDLGRFSLDNIEEISLYNGQRSRILQPAKDFGTSGTIYLRTRRPRFENNQPFNLRALFRTGSFDLINPSFSWEHRISGWDTEGNSRHHIASSVSAEYLQSSGRYRFRYRRVLPDGTVAWDTTAIRQNGDIQAFRLEGGLTGFTERTQWQWHNYFYDSERGIPGAIVNNVWRNSQRQWDRNIFTQGSINTTFSDRYELLINAKYAHDFLRYLNPDTTLMLIDNRFTQQEIYLSVANRFSIFPNWDVSLATDFQWNVLDANLQNFVRPTRYTTLVALATAVDFGSVRAQASLLGTLINEHADWRGLPNILPEHQARSAENRQELSPAVFVSYQPFMRARHASPLQPLTFRAFYKNSFRMPTFNDLYYTQIGNVSLRPEFTTQFNLGFQYAISMGRTRVDANYAPFRHSGIFQGLQISADVYYNEVTDKIVAIPRGSGQFRWMMMNLGRVEIRGLDTRVETSWLLPHDIGVQMAVSYTFQRAQDFSDPTDTDSRAGTWGGQIAYIPWHSGSFSLLASWRAWQFNYSFIYVGERYHNSSNIRENHERPWYTSDISIGKTFQLRRGNRRDAINRVSTTPPTFRVSAEINNVFNQQYDVVLNYPMPGTNFRIILRLDI